MTNLLNSFVKLRNLSLTIHFMLFFINMAQWNLFLLFWVQCAPREDHLYINT